ncbi:MAG: rhomboid family intramembrane serine protease [Sphingobacteriales bacterium]|nr:MAG: rhomboid family intramembrane serine protease [Sphingobacteriales bacterium]
MKTIYRKSTHPLIPGYHENGALQLVAASGVTFILFHFTRIMLLMMEHDKQEVFNLLFPNLGLNTLEMLKHKWWTVITYGWVHHGFFDWFTNMIWLYCFGSVLQNLCGYRQLIPLFAIAIIAGGAFYEASQLFYVPDGDHSAQYFFGAQAGVLALGVAALTLSPKYRLHIAPGFSIPLPLVVGIYLVLDIIVYLPDQLNSIVLCLGGALTGFIYAQVIKQNYNPGEWIYDTLGKVQNIATPNEEEFKEKKSTKRIELLRQMYEPKKGISQQRIDDILDKINEFGYHSLSREEKDVLFRAGKDN